MAADVIERLSWVKLDRQVVKVLLKRDYGPAVHRKWRSGMNKWFEAIALVLTVASLPALSEDAADDVDPIFASDGMGWYGARVQLYEEHQVPNNCGKHYGDEARLVPNAKKYACYVGAELPNAAQTKLDEELASNEKQSPSKRKEPGAIRAKYAKLLKCPAAMRGGQHLGDFICLRDLVQSEVCPKGATVSGSTFGGDSLGCTAITCDEGFTDLRTTTKGKYVGCFRCPKGVYDAEETMAWQQQRGGLGAATLDAVLCAAKDDAAVIERRKKAEAAETALLDERKRTCAMHATSLVESEAHSCEVFSKKDLDACYKNVVKGCVKVYRDAVNGGCGGTACKEALDHYLAPEPDPDPVEAISTAATPAAAPRTTAPCPEGMVRIPGMTTAMNNARGETIKVTSFCLDVIETTVAAYTACVTSGSCSPSAETAFAPGAAAADVAFASRFCNDSDDVEDHPVNCVDWRQADAYCRAKGQRLPTADEWLWAASAGDERRPYPWGSAPPDATMANGCGLECGSVMKKAGRPAAVAYKVYDKWATTAPVGSFPAGDSREGVHDLAGNVLEWTATRQQGGYMLKGGGWQASEASALGTEWAGVAPAEARDSDAGFRCVVDVAP